MKVCSSYSLENCKDPSFTRLAKTTLYYELNQNSILRLKNLIKSTADAKLKQDLQTIVSILKSGYVSQSNNESRDEPKHFTRRQLFDEFESLKILESVDALNDTAYFALLDSLEVAQIDKDGFRIKEQTAVKNTKDKSSISILKNFAEQVRIVDSKKQAIKSTKPKVLVVTASSRDNFEAVDFYLSMMQEMNLDAQWLPVSAALYQAVDQTQGKLNACKDLESFRQQNNQFDRARVYPELAAQQQKACDNPSYLNELIEQASGIFFNGGDQSKTLAAFVQNNKPSPYYKILKRQFEQNELFIAGTSAGAAVQAGGIMNDRRIPMISSGDSVGAVSRGVHAAIAPSQRCESDSCKSGILPGDLTYLPSGGLANFSFGITDTHFSERDREVRLITLSHETQTQYAFGVDETTALMARISPTILSFEIIGKNGVFVVDNTVSKSNVSQSDKSRSVTYAGSAHYLPSGTSGELEKSSNQWTLNYKKQGNIRSLKNGIWRNASRGICRGKDSVNFVFDDIKLSLATNPNTKSFFTNDNQHCGYLFVDYAVSYTNTAE